MITRPFVDWLGRSCGDRGEGDRFQQLSFFLWMTCRGVGLFSVLLKWPVPILSLIAMVLIRAALVGVRIFRCGRERD